MTLDELLSSAQRVRGERDTVEAGFIDGNDDFILWGAGSDGRNAMRSLQAKGKNVLYFIDSDRRKVGTLIEEKPVRHPWRDRKN